MNYVYKITNLVNNKLYIGITSKSIDDRLKSHILTTYNKSNKDCNSIFHKAIKKYGKENFVIEELDRNEDWEEIKKLEQFYIKKFNSFIGFENSNGYNSTLGGDGVLGYNTKKVAKVSPITGEIIEIYESITKAEKENCRGILESCKGTGILANGFTWFYFDDIKELSMEELKNKTFKKCNVLLQLDSNGNILKVWKEVNEVSRVLKISQGNISSVCAGKRRMAGGFRWMFYNDYIKMENKEMRQIKTTSKAVDKYSLDGNFICSYSSISEASKENDIKDNRICEVCKGKRNQAGGFIWKYCENDFIFDENKYENIKVIEKGFSKKKKIKNIDTGEIFESISEASRKYKCSRKTLLKACSNKEYKCANHFWEFIE